MNKTKIWPVVAAFCFGMAFAFLGVHLFQQYEENNTIIKYVEGIDTTINIEVDGETYQFTRADRMDEPVTQTMFTKPGIWKNTYRKENSFMRLMDGLRAEWELVQFKQRGGVVQAAEQPAE